jgi:hypothetical protein
MNFLATTRQTTNAMAPAMTHTAHKTHTNDAATHNDAPTSPLESGDDDRGQVFFCFYAVTLFFGEKGKEDSHPLILQRRVAYTSSDLVIFLFTKR